jgi:hypothetical protein
MSRTARSFFLLIPLIAGLLTLLLYLTPTSTRPTLPNTLHFLPSHPLHQSAQAQPLPVAQKALAVAIAPKPTPRPFYLTAPSKVNLAFPLNDRTVELEKKKREEWYPWPVNTAKKGKDAMRKLAAGIGRREMEGVGREPMAGRRGRDPA